MLEIKNLYVSFNGLPIINDVSMQVRDGEIVSLIGANGAGKTTLVRAISRLNAIASGSVVFNGEDITRCAAERIVEMGLIQVPEGRALFPRMSVRENLEIGAYNKNARKHMARNFELVYSLFPELEQAGSQAAGNLSGGQQQMVAIGRGIMADPKLLILDEPSIGLSPLMTQKVLKAVESIKHNGVSVLISEQNVMDVLKMAQYAYVMQQGAIVLSGPAETMMNDDAVKKAYIGM